MSTIYAITNQKGGVGKTTTAINLGAALAQAGQRVLIVDADPQSNATSSLGFDKHAAHATIYDAMIREQPLDEVVQPTDIPGVDLIPATPALAGAEVELVPLLNRERRLKRALSNHAGRYDTVLIDCPPSLGLLTVNALSAADEVLIPVQCEYLPLEGLSLLMRTIDLVRRHLNPELRLAGLALTMHDVRTNLAQQVVEEVRRHFPDQCFNTIIPRSVRLSEAPSYGESILTYAPKSAGAVAYGLLAQELLEHESGFRQAEGRLRDSTQDSASQGAPRPAVRQALRQAQDSGDRQTRDSAQGVASDDEREDHNMLDDVESSHEGGSP